jgi:predicted enzyme related to lactoylglutathione lyase
MNRFHRYELRTTDADAARAFYAKLFGHDRAKIWPLHEQAIARGARPHWLGQVGVDDLTRATDAFVERGAVPYGPIRPNDGGGQISVLRDPGGALLALSTQPPADSAPPLVDVVWHVLNTNDQPRALTNYRELLGWDMLETIDAGPDGSFRKFAWAPGGESVGAIGDIADRPGVHAQWLYFFATDALDRAIATTRESGGLVLPSIVLPNGDRAAICDDPQGAAFALLERRPRSPRRDDPSTGAA